MAARRLHGSAGACKAAPRGKPFAKGHDPRRGSGRSSEEVEAERQRRELLVEIGKEHLREVFEEVARQAKGGSAPHAKLFLSYVVGEPEQVTHVTGEGYIFTIRKRVVDGADGDPG